MLDNNIPLYENVASNYGTQIATKKVSFVIPCYKSEDTVLNVIDEINIEAKKNCIIDYEIITINDCSPDNVLQRLIERSRTEKHLVVLDLARNQGKHAALMAGYSICKGDYIVSLDDDGQCPIEKVAELISPLVNGFDVSIAKYYEKKQSNFKNFGSHMNDKMLVYFLGKPKELQFSNFFALKKFVMVEMLKYEHTYPYIEGLILRSTNKITNVNMDERSRLVGNGNFTFIKSLNLWINGFTSFSVKPLHIATICGLILAFSGFALGLYVIIKKLLVPDISAGYTSLMSVIVFVGGMLMVMLGIIGEYIGRIYICVNRSPQFVIRSMYKGAGTDDTFD